MPAIKSEKFYRVIDANFNRAKEGLRVCEDVCRFILDGEKHSRQYKRLRHQLTQAVLGLGLKKLIAARDSVADVGKKTSPLESRRQRVEEVFYANAQRVKESVRVLEEFAKLVKPSLAERLKCLRYELYGLEKDVVKRLKT